MSATVEWWERHQVALYAAAIGADIAVGLVWPTTAPVLSASTNPVLALLLFATFLGVPLIEVGRAFRDVRFLGTVLVVNFVLVPVIAFGLSRFVTDDQGLLIGVLLVLLTPCVDYVIVFRSRDRPAAPGRLCHRTSGRSAPDSSKQRTRPWVRPRSRGRSRFRLQSFVHKLSKI